ncbi:hypothetical protein NY78_2908 [Desulfovibrio sp. TomC]|nr:hypothetical protein NY78_2908 [Desulfovibrio sp. TomC]
MWVSPGLSGCAPGPGPLQGVAVPGGGMRPNSRSRPLKKGNAPAAGAKSLRRARFRNATLPRPGRQLPTGPAGPGAEP